ncbi:MAG: hypothetical protein B9S32_11730 [Verrucomicrobia bacterium Tous-C9LFEB]|nr:MAG: hypothetical protein B9S32_11730 [Verrucomicrobia bacterium Tous-C9LFEB]
MKLSNLSSAQLNQITRLIAKKETLLTRLLKIDAELAKFEGGPLVSVKSVKASVAPVARKARKGGVKLKDSILKALAAAGAKGVKVGDLAKKLGVKPGNVFSWFYTTGKKNSAIKKVGEARYALTK